MKFNSDRSCLKALAFLMLVDRNGEGESIACVALVETSGRPFVIYRAAEESLLAEDKLPGHLG